MSHVESTLAFESGDASLLGILALPALPANATPRSAMVIVVGGPQYRVGSHRQFTLLARHLADAGIAVLRFDYAGMGDSSGPRRAFTDAGQDIRAAIDALHARLPGLEAVTLWGLCDGASAALLYLDEAPDPRVKGLCLVNPWVRSDESLARAQIKHYYTARLMQADFWKKLLSGRVAFSALSELGGKLRNSLAAGSSKHRETLSFQQRMARAWTAFPGGILLMLSELDLVAKEFVDYTKSDAKWDSALRRRGVQIEHLPDADHTCSNAGARGRVESCTLAWHRELAAKA